MKQDKKRAIEQSKKIILSIFLGIFLIVFVQLVSTLGWDLAPSYNSDEDIIYFHNLSDNISGGYNNNITFRINITVQTPITLNNGSVFNFSQEEISSWIFITNETLGSLTINATHDYQTGLLELPISAKNSSPPIEEAIKIYTLIINATNDAPVFSNLDSIYLIPEPVTGNTTTISAVDEEGHYPLSFSVNFTSCDLAEWSSRKNESGEDNCTLFGITQISNNSFNITLTASRDDVGEYNATFYINDSGKNYECPHEYCNASTYEQNKSNFQTVTFKVLSSFDINASNCSNTFVDEGSPLNCVINITTTDLSENLSVWSNASLRNYAGSVLNQSWFYYNSSNQTSQQSIISIPISVVPNRTEIGNWTINFSARDSSGRVNSTTIFVLVNRTLTDESPSLQEISDINTSINIFNSTEVIAFDSDLLIPDKNESFGGYNETITFNLELLDRQTLSLVQIASSNFNITSVLDSNTLDNQTSALISFFFNESHPGNYTVRVNASDKENHLDSILFNLTVIDNTAPQWNNSKDYTLNFTVNSTRATTIGEIFADLVSEEWVTDLDSDPLSFSASESMTYFNLTSDGILNFTPYKEDVGFHQVTIYATDSWGLISSKIFYFNISNINSPPIITEQNSPVSLNESDSLTNANLTSSLGITVYDEDLLIKTDPDLLNLTWVVLYKTNQSIAPLNLSFNWTNPHTADNSSSYSLIPFVPIREEIGNYTVQILVNDSAGAQDDMNFTLEIKRLYYTPSINYPEEGFVFNLIENSTFSLIFNANQSGSRNLTYNLYIEGQLKGNFSSWGNGANTTWNFAPNFTDETYGALTNLTLIVLNPYENISRNFSVNITHTNSPVYFIETISDKHNETGETIAIDLTEHFSDVDAFDEFYNQTVNFTVTGNTTPSKFTWQINNWSLIFSSSVVGLEQFNITSEDLNSVDNSTLTSAISNSFVIEFEEQDTEVIPEPEPSGGGSGGSSPSTCVPSWNAAIGLCINGFRNITYWDSKKCFTNFTDNASCDDPGTILQKLVFTEELITVEHPECIEALEAVREAENLINQGQLKEASTKLDGVVNWCRNSIAQSSEAAFTRDNEEPQRGLVWWVAVIFSISLFLEIIYYFIYRKVRLRRIANTKI